MSASEIRTNRSDNDEKKMTRRDNERQRRQQMALLNASLRSQLPLELIKGKRSVSDHINEAVNHINNMKNKIEQLTIKKDKLESSSNISRSSPKSETSTPDKQSWVNSVVIRPRWGGMEVMISSGGLSGEDLPLSSVLEVLVVEEGLNVVRCASTKANGRLIHTIQAEVDDINSVDLSELQQKLSMCGPENTQEEVFQDVQDTNLKDDQSIAWRGDTDDIKNIQDEVLDRLQRLTELQKLHTVFWVQQKLHIQLYEDKIFPNWGGHGSFSCLVKVDLGYCKSCYCFPSLGQLPFLKKLHIEGFDRVERIGDEFYSTDSLSSSKPFKSLESLTFSHMSRWKEWSLMKNGVFSDLKQLTLDNCRKLKGTCFPSYLPSLQSLLISGCQKQVVASLSTDGLPLLSLLKIGHCTELESFPTRALPANVDTVKIMGCKQLVSLSEDGWPSNLKSLEISYCGKLFGNSLWWNVRTLTSLTSLQIIKIDEVVDSFPEEWQLPTTLKSLTLRHFRNLKSLNGKALQHLTSLKELKIEFCHLLHYLPEEGLPDSLSELEIFGCGFLNGRCHKERGEDWPKISHIPHIRIDCKDI